jgi:hypothetical protein
MFSSGVLVLILISMSDSDERSEGGSVLVVDFRLSLVVLSLGLGLGFARSSLGGSSQSVFAFFRSDVLFSVFSLFFRLGFPEVETEGVGVSSDDWCKEGVVLVEGMLTKVCCCC